MIYHKYNFISLDAKRQPLTEIFSDSLPFFKKVRTKDLITKAHCDRFKVSHCLSFIEGLSFSFE